MGFVDAVKVCFAKYVMFQGRATRSEYWWWILFFILVIVGVSLLAGDTAGNLVALALLLPHLAVGARRLHDIGKSGWWLLISFIPLVGTLVLLYFAVQPSQAGSNEYGPAPAN
jgi:uncharacterized membrane protein YhaH (DUF805 family)